MAPDPAGIGPFFETFGEIHSRLVKASSECSDPGMAELFRALAGQMESTGGELKAVATESVEAAQKLFQETRQATETALSQGRETVDQLQSQAKKALEFLESAPKQPAKGSGTPQPAIPKVKTSIIPKGSMDFSPGDILREWLMPPAPAQAAPASTPHTHGNIWDNWKAVAPTNPGDDNFLEDERD